jgi:organic hydroperoxide reductase OsmC/OhrA
MHRYEARVRWERHGARFLGQDYSRGHEWSFDGGVTVPASASPHVVRAPLSVAAAVDPEEALIAATSSCHMLFFLSLASKQGFVVERYQDDAEGVMDKNAAGRTAFTRITLRPSIEFGGDRRPSPEELESLHHAAHEQCYISNTLTCEIVVESREASPA